MNWRTSLCAAVLCGGLILGLGAADKDKKAREYQVTGPVLEVEDNLVTVEKNQEKWQIDAGADASKIKVGDKVTMHYRMVATKVEKK